MIVEIHVAELWQQAVLCRLQSQIFYLTQNEAVRLQNRNLFE